MDEVNHNPANWNARIVPTLLISSLQTRPAQKQQAYWQIPIS